MREAVVTASMREAIVTASMREAVVTASIREAVVTAGKTQAFVTASHTHMSKHSFFEIIKAVPKNADAKGCHAEACHRRRRLS